MPIQGLSIKIGETAKGGDMVNRNARMILGVILIAIGVLSIGNIYGWWKLPNFMAIWWTLIIIIPYLTDMFSKGIRPGNTIGLAGGIWFLLLQSGVIKLNSSLAFTRPLAIVLIGLACLLNR